MHLRPLDALELMLRDGMPPPVPEGRAVELAGRGTTYVRELPGPPGAPTLVLLHGWMGSGGLNWCRVFEPLGREFRVLAPDFRGHGRGMRARAVFRLDDCADDLAALLDASSTGPVVLAGTRWAAPSRSCSPANAPIWSLASCCAPPPRSCPSGRRAGTRWRPRSPSPRVACASADT